jgi:signal transduction histidine kinase
LPVPTNNLLVNNVAMDDCQTSSSMVTKQSTNGGAPSRDEHFVQFYESEDFLIDSITNFVISGFDSGETVLVLATASHLNSLRGRLLAMQISVEQLEAVGRFVVLDAEKVHADLTVDGVLNRERFNQFFGGLLSQARDARRPIRVFGELVAVLWAQGKYATAIQVEELWNRLKNQTQFSLFCAYPLQGFAGKDLTEPLKQICLTHSRIIPAESYSSLDSLDEKVLCVTDLQQKSVSFEREVSEHDQTREQLRVANANLELQLTTLQEALHREQKYRAEAEAANSLKDVFLATVSHELRTPLNAIVGWSHLLNQGRLDASTSRRAMESIERNAKAQAQMIEDLLDVSRLAAGTLKLNVAEVELAVSIHEAINSLRPNAEAKKIELVVEADPADLIIADSRRLQQIVWHLLDNAIKFTAPNGRVCIQLKQTEQEVEIAVKDSGQGIEPDFLDCVFEKFWQADSSTTRRHGGLGVGLSIVRYLVELHGGSVCVESEGPARGSRFVVKLPSQKPAK